MGNETLINLPGAVAKDWTVVVDDCAKAPYMYNGPYWIGYDDEESVVAKTKFANFMDLGGYFVWSIEFDNFRGDWGQPKYPLLKKVHEAMNSGEVLDPKIHTALELLQCVICSQQHPLPLPLQPLLP